MNPQSVVQDRVLEQMLTAVSPHGVAHLGACPLSALPSLLPCRRARELPERGSVLLALLPYYTGEHPRRNVSLYAVPDDYHQIAAAILKDAVIALSAAYPDCRWLPFVDSSPIPEVAAAVLAGLGWQGKNGQLITPWYGSMTFVCELVTDLELPATVGVSGSCGSCRRCIDACPTGALGDSGLDSSRCRSAITQKKGELTGWEQTQVRSGGMAWGCDICTTACPKNHPSQPTTVAALAAHTTPVVTLEALPDLLPHKSYGWRGQAVVERNLKMIGKERD